MTAKSLKQRIQYEAYRIVLWQLASVIILALIVLIISNARHSYSILTGGMAYGLANLMFVWRVFRYAHPQEMPSFMRAFYIGEGGKLIISAFLFLLVVKYLPVSLSSVLIGYISAIMAFWIACMRHFSKRYESED